MIDFNELKRDLVPVDSDADKAAEVAKRDPERGDAEGPFGHESEQPPQSVDELLTDLDLPEPQLPS